MNAETLKRIVRAIGEGSQADLDRLADKLVAAERRTGHARLADQLEAILADARQRQRGAALPPTTESRQLTELPQNRRYGQQLATLVPREELEHHMVLPPATEERFNRIECEFAARERLEAHGLRHRRTILLYGPPGCGKSLGAKRLAWNTGLPLMKVQFDALISSYFGESAAHLRLVFSAAKQRACVLLLDECDFIARARGNASDVGEANRIVNSLLQLMEDYDAPGLLVATTNIESALDPALFRRFDEVLEVPPPGPLEIERLLKLSLAGVQVESDVDWTVLAHELRGVSAALVVKTARDAAKAVVLRGGSSVSATNLRTAIAELRRGAM